MEFPHTNHIRDQKKYIEFETRRVPIMRSLFFRIFIYIFSISIISAAVSSTFIIVIYQSLLRVNMPEYTILLAGGALRIRYVVTFLFIILLVSAFAYLVARNITSPIKKLILATQRITEGDLDVQITLNRQDEFGKLATFFNLMVQRFIETQDRNLAISRIKSQFVSVAAHQLRTPLSALKWTMRMLLDGDVGKLQKEQYDFLKRGYDTNERMIQLVNDFLDVSRIEEGRFGFNFEKISIATSIRKATEDMSLAADHKHVSITTAIKIPDDLMIIGDEDRLHTVFTNILDNAILYNTEQGNISISVFVRTDNFLQIDIADTGIGIPVEERGRIFTRFYRASNAIRQQTDGSGLGLFIVQNIIERHGGTIWFTSEKNKGTTISFTLPLKNTPPQTDDTSFKEFMEAV